jgi:hypothetical protein
VYMGQMDLIVRVSRARSPTRSSNRTSTCNRSARRCRSPTGVPPTPAATH